MFGKGQNVPPPEPKISGAKITDVLLNCVQIIADTAPWLNLGHWDGRLTVLSAYCTFRYAILINYISAWKTQQ